MKNKKPLSPEWKEAQQKCRLNRETLQMAREMGLNPRKLIKNMPNKSEPWKAPIHVWIREIYAKRQKPAEKARQESQVDPIV